MFFLISQLFFRINSPDQIQSVSHSKRKLQYLECLKQQKESSVSFQEVRRKCRYLKEETDDDFDGLSFENTVFNSKNTIENEYIISADEVPFQVTNCQFDQCSFTNSMIFSNNPEYNFTMTHNIITNCYNKNVPISSTNLVNSQAFYSIIQNNTITFSSKDAACRAYLIQKCVNIIFKDNKVTNANVGSDIDCIASGLFCNGTTGENGDPIEISGCTFSSCYGGKGSILRVCNFSYHIQIYNTTFEKSQNNLQISEPKVMLLGYFLSFDSIFGTDEQLSFRNCTFDFLESSSAGGAIGLWYKNDGGNDMRLTFEYTKFTNLYYSSNSNPGGAILISPKGDNIDIVLNVTDCEFINISTAGDGAAIYYDSENNVTIERTSFIDAITPADSGVHAAIFTNYGSNNYEADINNEEIIYIKDCTFESTNLKNENNAATIILQQSKDSDVICKSIIDNCQFTKTTSKNYAIVSDILIIELINSQISSQSGGISISSVQSLKISNTQFSNINSLHSIYVNKQKGTEADATITKCVFDGFTSAENGCIDIKSNSGITFSDNEIRNVDINGKELYVAKMEFSVSNYEFVMQNITFEKNKCNALYGGGAGVYVSKVTKLIFNECKFNNNYAKQNTIESRPLPTDINSYYNGDGGAIQIGYDSETSKYDVAFTSCHFTQNQAYRHGGAIAIQTGQKVTITGCIFTENAADIKNEPTRQIRIDNHFDKKKEGRGGAIYINPCFSYNNNDFVMTSIDISGCTFKSNKAFDGFAIYIEGDEKASTTFVINNNDFINNFANKDDDLKSHSAVITSEIFNISDNTVTNDGVNTWTIDPIINKLSYVDHYGNPAQVGDIIYDYSCDANIRCYRDATDEENPVKVIVLKTTFKDFRIRNYGGAIYLVKCGIKCNVSTFENCQAIYGGGALFIKYDSDLPNSIEIDGIKFTGCKATYGGAMYIYSGITKAPVTVFNSEFRLNKITDKPAGYNDESLIGGNSIFITARKGRVESCYFDDENSNDDHGSVKFYNNFAKIPDSNHDLKMLEKSSTKEDFFSIINCKFKASQNTKNSIEYIRGLSDIGFEVEGCTFTGHLSEKSHYIEEKVIQAQTSPKLRIKSCKFSFDSSKSLLLDSSNDLKQINLQNEFSGSIKSKDSKLMNAKSLKVFTSIFLPACVIITVIVISLTILVRKKRNGVSSSNDSDESNDEIDL